MASPLTYRDGEGGERGRGRKKKEDGRVGGQRAQTHKTGRELRREDTVTPQNRGMPRLASMT